MSAFPGIRLQLAADNRDGDCSPDLDAFNIAIQFTIPAKTV
jgi:hypothetical protein